MAQTVDKLSTNEANGSSMRAEQTKDSARPPSPLSGGSDNDGAERPVREKLKKASIAGLSTQGKENGDGTKADALSSESSTEDEKSLEDTMQTDITSPLRGRPTRKRSFDDLQNDPAAGIDAPLQDDAVRAEGHHKRMRSKDMSSNKTSKVNGKAGREQVEPLAEEEDDVEAQKSPGGAGIIVEPPTMEDAVTTSGNQSPKKKRSRDQFDKDDSGEDDPLRKEEDDTVLPERQPLETEDEAIQTTTDGDRGEPDKKRHRDVSREGREAAGKEQATVKVWVRYSGVEDDEPSVVADHYC